MNFLDKLHQVQASAGSALCVGLDPEPDRFPLALARRPPAEALARFCIAITEACTPFASAFKPNLAFFEAFGYEGWRALEEVCSAVRASGRLLVLDGKRGDIGNTARRYAHMLFDQLGADATTVTPYIGSDSLTPFLQHEGRCAFVLVATSNPGAADLQMLEVGGEPLYRHVARMAAGVGELEPSTVGFVVGATQLEALAGLRAEFPSTPFLVPGVGAQGGDADRVMRAAGKGPLLVTVSRSILYASSGGDFAEAAALEAQRLARLVPVESN